MNLNNVQHIITENDEVASKALEKFIQSEANSFAFPELTDDLRRELWKRLYELASTSSSHLTIANCFQALRILGREKHLLQELVSKQDWLGLIRKYSTVDFTSASEEEKFIAIEAEKCLCNLVFNSTTVAEICSENGILDSINDRVGTNLDLSSMDMMMIDVKLIFIITALCPQARTPLRVEKHGVDNLVHLLENILASAFHKYEGKISLTKEYSDLACEILKALFNITLRMEIDEKEIKRYSKLMKILLEYLLIPIASEIERYSLHINIINLMTNMPDPCLKELIPQAADSISENRKVYKGYNISALRKILELFKVRLINNGTVAEQHEIISPIATVLYKAACIDPIIRKYLRSEILPPLKDVHNRPEEGSTLRNGLCRLMTSPITQLRDIVCEFLFFLCKMNVNRMIKYTGYGNAAALFAQRGLLSGKEDEGINDFSSDSEDSETEEYAQHKHGINPIMGCFQLPHDIPMADMTDEQKEIEALKLVKLMDDIIQAGTIKPCRINEDGKPEPIEHVLQLQEGLQNRQISRGESDSD